MNLSIIKMEVKRLLKPILLGIVSCVGYAALIMVFYISFSGTFEEMTEMFSDASLQGLLKAFSMDEHTFTYILNFYSSYSSVYLVLMGCIFSSILTVRLFSKEIKEGTFEFIYSTPLSRIKYFLSKTAVFVCFVMLLNIALFSTGYGLLEILKEHSPLVVWLDEDNKKTVIKQVLKNEDKFDKIFILDEELFYDVLYDSVSRSTSYLNEEGSDKYDMSDEDIKTMLNSFLQGPEVYMKSAMDNPKTYMEMFNIPEEEKETFLAEIEKEMKEFYYAKDNFASQPAIAIELFKENPHPFLQQLIDEDRLEQFQSTYEFSDEIMENIFIYYSLKNYALLSFATFMVILAVSSISLLLSVSLKRGKFSTGLAIGIAMLFYFMDIISNISTQAEFLKYFTPYGYLNLNVMDINYGIESWALWSLIGIISVCTTTAGIVFCKSDLVN